MKLGVLDYAPIDEGATPSRALRASTRLVQTAERLNYSRFWVSEHHGIEALASVSPEVLIGHLASATSRIRVGSGGVMLPHYSSVKVAENFKTLEALNPGRIDLGFGRAPGANARLSAALNDEKSGQLPYPTKVADLLGFVTGEHGSSSKYVGVSASPDAESLPLPWVLGASGTTAELAAANGIGFTFAHFINPSARGPRAVEQYRRDFRPGSFLTEPAVIAAVFIVVGQDAAEVNDLTAAFHLWLAHAESASPFSRIPSLERTREHAWSPSELSARERNEGRVIAGTAAQVVQSLRELADGYGTDEVMVNPMMPGEHRRLAALESLAAELAVNELGAVAQA
ncbi:LLM class flavin-dependent oxidoreductase [Paenarthrobacter sp. NPDC092416]|uniref:LLM class flavin-dependent oxidoreductase n=1 Tax=Paenarthrobacter sp. NPDC092416 TaxID=3364386 RepID=UPI0037F97377